MPLVTLSIPSQDLIKHARMPTPTRKVGDVWKWFAEARKAIPEIPNPVLDGWGIKEHGSTLEKIAFELESPNSGFAYVTIDRTIPYIG